MVLSQVTIFQLFSQMEKLCLSIHNFDDFMVSVGSIDPLSYELQELLNCLLTNRAEDIDQFKINIATMDKKRIGDLYQIMVSPSRRLEFGVQTPNFYHEIMKLFFSSDINQFLQSNSPINYDYNYENIIRNFFLDSFQYKNFKGNTLETVTELYKENKLSNNLFDTYFNHFIGLYNKDPKLRDFFQDFSLPIFQKYRKKHSDFIAFINRNPNLPSVIHLESLQRDGKLNVLAKECMRPAFDQFMHAIEKEKQLKQAGYVTFFHGQASGYAFINDVANALYEQLKKDKRLYTFLNSFLSHLTAEHDITYQKNSITPVDFFFLQFPSTEKPLINEENGKNQMDFSELIEGIKAEHATMLTGRDIEKEPLRVPHRLSLNLFAFGNLTNPGSCTFTYVGNNTNVNKPDIAILKKFFEKFEIPATLFEKYENRIKQIMEKYEQQNKTGRLICFAFPKKTVDENVYIARIGAYKIEPELNGQKASTITKLVDLITTENNIIPFTQLDRLEFATPLTSYGALNPHSGIKLFKFDDPTVAQAEKEQLKNDMSTLVNDIIFDLKQENILEKTKSIVEMQENIHAKIAQEKNINKFLLGGITTGLSSYLAMRQYARYKDWTTPQSQQQTQPQIQQIQSYQPIYMRPFLGWRLRTAQTFMQINNFLRTFKFPRQ
jgi:hypothetical protein